MEPNSYESPDEYPQEEFAPVYDRDANNWAMVLHLSQFAGYASFGLGFLVPILIWQLKKQQYPSLDEHGREVVNWMISAVIYGVICAVLWLMLIGIPLMMLLGALAVIYPIVGGIKASDGQLWRYPGTIRIL